MQFWKHGCLVGLLALTVAGTASAQQRNIEQRIDSLLRIMTLDEKIGQMNQYNGFWEATGPAPSEGDAKRKYEHLEKGLVGSVLNVTGVENVRKMQELVVTKTRLGIPLIFGFDAIHGYKTISPVPLAEAASWDLKAIEASAKVSAIETSSVGINWTFAPMVDISRDPRWGRVMEGAGEDPYLGSKIAVARVRGFQGDNFQKANTVAACAKHFAGYGFAEGGRDYNTVDVGTVTLFNDILPPFKAAADSGVKTFMNSFNVLNGVPATANSFLQRDILKGRWNYPGMVVSDWGSGVEMVAHGYARDLAHVAELAANAGSDMDMESYAYVAHLKAAVESGKVSMAVIDDAVRRILRLKFELGLMDDPYRYCNAEREKTLLGHPDHQAAVLDIAQKSIVLLKNDRQLLPLKKGQPKVAVIGALAADKDSPLGNWRLAAESNSAVSVVEGLKNHGVDFTYAKGADVAVGQLHFVFETAINETDTSGFKEAVELARKSEVVIMVLGENGFQSGEGRSRSDLGLPGVQQRLLEAVHAVNPNIVLVLMSGRPLAVTWADEHIPTIVEAWHLGSQSGNAIAKVLTGEYNPSGKLPMTFPRTAAQIPMYYNHYSTGRPGPKKEVFWSHYIDGNNTPLYPFGHGLSYTTFEYSGLQADATDSKAVKVKVTVKNTGSRDGEEVVQLYLHDKFASVVRPVKQLKGFEKVALRAGETRELTFTLTPAELGFYNEKGDFIVEPGDFDVMVGGSSATGLTTGFTLR